MDKNKHIKINIFHNAKKEILIQLALVGISRKTLFPDYQGFAEWFTYGAHSDKEKYYVLIRKA